MKQKDKPRVVGLSLLNCLLSDKTNPDIHPVGAVLFEPLTVDDLRVLVHPLEYVEGLILLDPWTNAAVQHLEDIEGLLLDLDYCLHAAS